MVGVSTPPRRLAMPTIKRVEMPLKRERVIKEEKVTPFELETEFQDSHNNHLMDVSYKDIHVHACQLGFICMVYM